MTFADYFSASAAAYAAYRPTYPDALFAFLAREAPARDAAWDAATGSGQAAVALGHHFRHVIATDASQAQLDRAVRHVNVEYRVGSAEQSGLADASMDLVTAAQAVHWFDQPRFWREVRRVLRPRGVIAVWTYGMLELSPALDEIVQRFYTNVVGPFWRPERRQVEQRYQNIDFPFHEFTAPDFTIEQRMTLDEVAGYVRTWSATREFMKQHQRDPVETLAGELSRAWGSEGPRSARWPVAMRIGRV